MADGQEVRIEPSDDMTPRAIITPFSSESASDAVVYGTIPRALRALSAPTH